MSTTVTFKGSSYTIPSPGDSDDWGTLLNAFLVALADANPAVKTTLTGSAAVAPLRLTPGPQPTGPNAIGDIYVTSGGVVYVCTVAGTPGTWVPLAVVDTVVPKTLTGSASAAPLVLTPGSQPTGPNVVGALYVTSGGAVYVCTVAGTPGTWAPVGPPGGGTTYEYTSEADEEHIVTTRACPVGSILELKVTAVANVDQDGLARTEPGGAFSGSTCNVSTWRNTGEVIEGIGTAVALWNQAASPDTQWSVYADVNVGEVAIFLVNSSGTMLIDWNVLVESKLVGAA